MGVCEFMYAKVGGVALFSDWVTASPGIAWAAGRKDAAGWLHMSEGATLQVGSCCVIGHDKIRGNLKNISERC